ncbi:MAG: hypothetical protein AAFU79_19885, partial [Myxococcota bacterium]
MLGHRRWELLFVGLDGSSNPKLPSRQLPLAKRRQLLAAGDRNCTVPIPRKRRNRVQAGDDRRSRVKDFGREVL